MAKKEKAEMQEKVKKPIYKKWWFWVIIVLVVFGAFGGGSKKTATEETAEPTEQTEEATTEEKSEAITLTFGDVGEYGTKETLGDKEYIAYRVPAGTYTATNKGENMAQVTIYKDGTQTNEDGVEEQIMGDQKPLMLDVGKSDTLTVGEGEYIEIYDNEVIELVAQ